MFTLSGNNQHCAKAEAYLPCSYPLPTEKPHGYQICKTWVASVLREVDVLLLHPYRHQSDVERSEAKVFDYHGARPIFEIRTLPNWDLVLLNRITPDP
jgi:hypothetical protein